MKTKHKIGEIVIVDYREKFFWADGMQFLIGKVQAIKQMNKREPEGEVMFYKIDGDEMWHEELYVKNLDN